MKKLFVHLLIICGHICIAMAIMKHPEPRAKPEPEYRVVTSYSTTGTIYKTCIGTDGVTLLGTAPAQATFEPVIFWCDE